MQLVPYLTKVRLPQRRPDVLRRSRLVDFIHESVDKRLILVCAAAGYGKTTLLVDFAHDSGLPVCWYSLDTSDADPRAFFDYLLLSIRQRFPQFGRHTESLLASVTDVSHDVNSVVASLVNEIQSDIPEYFLLVLDDFHCVEGSDVVNSALDLLIYYLPDNCHLVVSTRVLPALTFSRLAAQRQVAGLGTGDLRFNPEELRRLLRDNYKLTLPAKQAEEMIGASEGWITGILLSTHTAWMGLVESIVKAKGAGSALFDYLANEAYLQQPLDVQRFLLCSSVLDRLNPYTCDRLFAGGSAQGMLHYLMRANLFIEEIEGPGEWHRYHNLFQSFLQSKLRAEDLELYRRLHEDAAGLSEEADDWDAAISHFQEAGAVKRAAELLERVGDHVINAGRWQTLGRWLDALPSAMVEGRPALELFRGRTFLWSGESDRAIAFLANAADRYRELGDVRRAGSALTLKSMGLRLKGQHEEALAACADALSIQAEKSSRIVGESHREIGICLASQGRLVEATDELRQALDVYSELNDEAGIATTSQAAGIVAVKIGDLAAGMASYQHALGMWNRLGNLPSAALVLNSIAMVHHYTGEYPEALRILDDALARAEQGGYLRIRGWVLSSVGDVRRDSGELQLALDAYEAAMDIAHRADEMALTNYVLDGLSNTHRLMGDFATAERLIREALQQAEANQSQQEIATYSISLGVLAHDQGDSYRAEAALRSAIELLARTGARRDLARARFHLGMVLFEKNELDAASLELESVLEMCRLLGYDQFMVAEGQRASPLLSWALSKGIGGRRLENVVERLRRTHPISRLVKRPRIHVQSVVPTQIRVHSFGHPRVFVDTRLISPGEWAIEKTRELFFYLLLQPHSQRRDQIVDDLWPDLELGRGSSQFHSTLYRLRRAVFPQCVVHDDGRYRLQLGPALWFDASEFARLVEEANGTDLTTERREEAYEEALRLYQGPFLEDIYSEWVLPLREKHEATHLRTLRGLAAIKAEMGQLEQALHLLESALAADPYQEEAHYSLIHYSALMGNRTGALRRYRDFVQLMREDLDAQPSRRLVELAERIASGEAIPSL